jgi:hypothetical protein
VQRAFLHDQTSGMTAGGGAKAVGDVFADEAKAPYAAESPQSRFMRVLGFHPAEEAAARQDADADFWEAVPLRRRRRERRADVVASDVARCAALLRADSF